MKKKKSVYFFLPIVLLVLFAAYYWNFRAGYEAKQEARAAQIKRVHDEKVAKDNDLRRKAVEDAVAAEKKRAAERQAKAEKDRQDREDLDNARDARDIAISQVNKLRDKYNNLVKLVKDTGDDIAKVDADKTIQIGTLDFLQIDTAKAESNVQSLTDVLNQISAADAAYEAAAAAARRRRPKSNRRPSGNPLPPSPFLS